MAGKQIAKILDKAFQKVGNVLGWDFKHYRPDIWVQPLQDRNQIGVIKLSATVDDGYTTVPKDLDEYKLYTDGSKLQPGDILYSDELSKTYVVTEKQELQVTKGVLANDRINLLRPVSTTGDVKRSFEQLASLVPAAVTIRGSSKSAGVLRSTTSSMQTAQHEIEILTWLPDAQLNDVVELNGNRYVVLFVDRSDESCRLQLRSTKVGV